MRKNDDDDREFITKKDKNGNIIKFDAETGKRVPKRTAKQKKPDPHQVRQYFKPKTDEAANVIYNIMIDGEASPNQRLRAAEMILHYGWGRPPKMRRFDDDGNSNPLEDISFRDLNMLMLKMTDDDDDDEDYIDV